MPTKKIVNEKSSSVLFFLNKSALFFFLIDWLRVSEAMASHDEASSDTVDSSSSENVVCEECGNGVQDIAERVRDLTARAEKGDEESMKKLAWHHENGVGVKRDLNKAFDLYTCAFHGPSGSITEALDDDTWTHNEEMIEMWLRLAGKGQAGSLNCAGVFHFVCQKDKEKGFECFEKSSRLGCVAAMNNVGWCYDKGEGVMQDETKAYKWYLKSANNGNTYAMNNVGVCYDKGQGVTQDKTKAFEWFLKSAENGNADAMFNVGLCYNKGQGVTQDFIKAYEWYFKAAINGNEEALDIMSRKKQATNSKTT